MKISLTIEAADIPTTVKFTPTIGAIQLYSFASGVLDVFHDTSPAVAFLKADFSNATANQAWVFW